MKRSQLYFNLPNRLIAQSRLRDPARNRLLAVSRADQGKVTHTGFDRLSSFLNAGDVLVLNDTKVMPARFWGMHESEGQVEITLVTRIDDRSWEALVRPDARNLRKGGEIYLKQQGLSLRMVKKMKSGYWLVKFDGKSIRDFLSRHAEVNIPFYISRQAKLSEYQTIYARIPGSTQCPTTGLHFTRALLREIEAKGVKIVYITLHIGGSIVPVVVRDFRDLRMHKEYFEIKPEAAMRINDARRKDGRVFAVGTTTVRALESAAGKNGLIRAKKGWTGLTIKPGHRFKTVDAFLTNFHMPGSSHLLMTSAFGGVRPVLNAYKQALARGYKFLDFGDAMLII